MIAVFDQSKAIEKILLSYQLVEWTAGIHAVDGTAPAAPKHREADDPQSRDPFPDNDNVFTCGSLARAYFLFRV